MAEQWRGLVDCVAAESEGAEVDLEEFFGDAFVQGGLPMVFVEGNEGGEGTDENHIGGADIAGLLGQRVRVQKL